MFHPTIISIDIGAFAIKFVELRKLNQKSFVLSKIGYIRTPPGIFENGLITNPRILGETINLGLKQSGFSKFLKRSALSINSSVAIIKNIKIPISNADVGETIYYEAEQYLEHDINDLYFDFYEFEKEDDESHTKVILIGVKQTTVEPYIQALKSVGLKIGILECDCISVANIAQQSYGIFEDLTCLIHLGHTNTQIMFIENQRIIFTRAIPIGGQFYTQSIATSLTIPTYQAEDLKIQVSNKMVRNEVVENIIHSINQQLSNEILQNFEYFKSGDSPPRSKILNKCILSGGGSKTLKLANTIASLFSVKTHIMNPFSSFKINNQQEKLIKIYGHQFDIAAGLAMRDFEYYE